MQPPRLAASIRGKLPYHLCSKYSRVRTKPISHQAVPFSPFKRTLSPEFAFALLPSDYAGPSLFDAGTLAGVSREIKT
jgi:hypothetical protein